jgi:succinyl-CoA synthetase beta subunit
VPLVVRLEGTNKDAAVDILNSVPGIITANDLGDAAKKAVEAAAS